MTHPGLQSGLWSWNDEAPRQQGTSRFPSSDNGHFRPRTLLAYYSSAQFRQGNCADPFPWQNVGPWSEPESPDNSSTLNFLTTVFSPSLLGFDPLQRMQMISFIIDLAPLWLIFILGGASQGKRPESRPYLPNLLRYCFSTVWDRCHWAFLVFRALCLEFPRGLRGKRLAPCQRCCRKEGSIGDFHDSQHPHAGNLLHGGPQYRTGHQRRLAGIPYCMNWSSLGSTKLCSKGYDKERPDFQSPSRYAVHQTWNLDFRSHLCADTQLRSIHLRQPSHDNILSRLDHFEANCHLSRRLAGPCLRYEIAAAS